jgi:hypothetical protein
VHRSAAMAERVVRRTAAGVGDVQPPAPWPLVITPRGRGAVHEDDEDGEDEYRAPYLACQMSRLRLRAPGDSPPRLLGKWHR